MPLLSCLRSKGAYYRYPLIEVITSILFFSSTLIWSKNYYSLAVIYLLILLITTITLNLNYKKLPYSFTQNILWSGIVFSWIGVSPISLPSAINGVTVGFISFYILLAIASFLIRRQIFRMNDVILFAGLGAWVGVFSLPYLVLMVAIIGILYIMITPPQKNNTWPMLKYCRSYNYLFPRNHFILII